MKAAFFDLDKTLISRTSSVAFANHFRKEKLFSRRAFMKLAWEHAKFMRRSGPEESMRLARLGLEMAKGQHQPHVQSLVTSNLTTVIEPLVYPRAVELLNKHRMQRDLIVIVSSSPVDVVHPIGQLFGADLIIASVPNVDHNQRFTGTLQFFSYGDYKVDAMKSLAASMEIDLTESWAYSDSITDLPMLRAVGNSVVVNPDDELLAVAVSENWKVEHFANPGTSKLVKYSTCIAKFVA